MSEDAFKIEILNAKQTLALRQKVLWPDHPIKQSMIAEDGDGFHLGGIIKGEVVSVASFFVGGEGETERVRLRKFATDPAYRKRGIGTELLRTAIDKYCSDGLSVLWCDAREVALPYYERLGFRASGDRFFKGDIPYRKAAYDLTQDAALYRS